MLSAALLLTVIVTGSSLPQLNIPANDNIFRSFPVTSGGGVQGEVTSISVAEVRAELPAGLFLLILLNFRITAAAGRLRVGGTSWTCSTAALGPGPGPRS